MPLRQVFVPAIITLTFSAPAPAAPVGQVKLEIVGDAQQGAGMSFQQWSQALGQAGIKARMRAATEADKPKIESVGTDQMPIYKVTGVLTSRDELVLPGARFRRSDAKRLAEWLDDIAKRGPPDRREPVVAFGLTEKQLEKAHNDLAKPTGFSTKGMTRSEAVNKIAGQLTLPLKIDGGLADGDDKIEEELSSLSCGTALACILRPSGFAMVPKESGDNLSYNVAKAQLDQPVWPIGWPPKKPQEAIPALYEFRNVSVSGFSAAKVLEAVGKQLGVPVLYDHNAMARYGIDPEKALVSHPMLRTNYSVALRKMLSKAGLKFEVRVDEAEKPFLWISTVKAGAIPT